MFQLLLLSCSTEPKDCAGIESGVAYLDDCEQCVGGTTEKVANYLKENPAKKLKDVTIACYGITYKPNIDDLRESPALKITQKIAKKHAGKVIVFEPNIKVLPEMLKKNKNLYLKSFNKKNSSTNIAVLLVDHREFKNINISASKKIDTRGIWSK